MRRDNRFSLGRRSKFKSASLCCCSLAGGCLLRFAGFRSLLIDYSGSNFFLASFIATFLFEFALNFFIFTFSFRAGTAWHTYNIRGPLSRWMYPRT
jgi:hypothetical protein